MTLAFVVLAAVGVVAVAKVTMLLATVWLVANIEAVVVADVEPVADTDEENVVVAEA